MCTPDFIQLLEMKRKLDKRRLASLQSVLYSMDISHDYTVCQRCTYTGIIGSVQHSTNKQLCVSIQLYSYHNNNICLIIHFRLVVSKSLILISIIYVLCMCTLLYCSVLRMFCDYFYISSAL